MEIFNIVHDKYPACLRSFITNQIERKLNAGADPLLS